jgi:hypothetical protein
MTSTKATSTAAEECGKLWFCFHICRATSRAGEGFATPIHNTWMGATNVMGKEV